MENKYSLFHIIGHEVQNNLCPLWYMCSRFYRRFRKKHYFARVANT